MTFLPGLPTTRRDFLAASVSGSLALCGPSTSSAGPLTAKGKGEVQTPTFHRHDIGTAPGRLHEPSVDADGNIWTSPLDGILWQYHAPTGSLDRFDLAQITGRKWAGLHLWPIATGKQILLCTPSLGRLWVWDRARKRVTQHDFPHPSPGVYGGHPVPGRPQLCLYDTKQGGVLLWDTLKHRGTFYKCPYRLSNTAYMMFIDRGRMEYWGSSWNGNDVIRFDIERRRWNGHFHCPGKAAKTVVGGGVFDKSTVYVSDMFNGRLFPLDAATGRWGDPLPVPGHRKWYGYLSGGHRFGDHLYFDHSTWTGANKSIDGQPHHFIGRWTVFDHSRKAFSRLDFPARPDETIDDLQADYAITYKDGLYLLAVHRKSPRRALVLRSRPLPTS